MAQRFIAWMRPATAVALAGLFYISLNQDAVLVCSNPPARGWQIAEIGWMGPIARQFGWYANLGLAWTLSRLLSTKPINFWAAGVAIVSLLIALTAIAWRDIPTEAGDSGQKVCGFAVGFYLWIACMLIGAIAMTAFAIIDKRQLQSADDL